MEALVTGGAGFIGRHLVELLVKKGHKVTIIDNLSNGRIENIMEFLESGKIKFIEADLSEPSSLHDLGSFDLIFHLAAQVIVQESIDNPPTSFKDNILSTYNILEFFRTKSKHATMVVVGTCMVYDTAGDSKISETHPLKPASPYAGSKIAAEEMALGYGFGLGLDVRIARPFNTYGPYQKSNHEGGVVNIFCKRFLEGKDLLIYGDGTQTRDLMYVKDTAEFIYKVGITDGLNGQTINGGTGRDISIKDLALLIAKDPNKIQFVPHHHPQSEIMRLVCDNTKAIKLLNWEPKYSLEEGIQETINFLKSFNEQEQLEPHKQT